MAPPLLTLRNIHLTFGGTPLLTGTDLMIHERDRVCLVGRNGSGKSTMMKIAAGFIEPDKGERRIKPGVTVRYLEQNPDFTDFDTISAFIEAGLAPGDDPYRVTLLLDALGLNGDENPSRLSGGEARRAALIRALAPEPDILMLDEPTNHLDLPAIEWLEAELKALKSALVIISHDRRFLENMTRRTVWLDRGETRELKEGFGAFEAWRDTVLEQEELERHKLDRKIVREEHWITYGVTARRKRNVRRLKELEGLRNTRRNALKIPGKAKLETIEGGASGKLVIEALNISKSYGEKRLVRDFSIRIKRGDRIGITGPNGAGKTTLLKILMGELAPDNGNVRSGTNLEVISLDQRRDNLKPETRLMDALTGGRGDMVSVGGQMRHVMSYLKDFLFIPEQARSPISALSGGEKGRLALAIALARPSNLLVLDEPTNDLDLETLDLLQEMLSAYAGTVLLISHDRDFLDRTVTSTIAPEGDGIWREYAGGYTDMTQQKEAVLRSVAARTPRRANSPAKPVPKTSNLKLTYKEKYALETLPDDIEQLQKQIALYQEKIADADFFTKDPVGFQKVVTQLETAENTLSDKEEQWLELELKQEALNS